MKKLYDLVRIYVDGETTIESIGMTSGVIEWVQGETKDILADSWRDTIKNSVNISVSGNEQTYYGTSISILKTALVEETLQNFSLTLVGKRLEVFETDGVDENLLFRGVIQVIGTSGNNRVLEVAHVSNFYGTDMTPRVGRENAPLYFGESSEYVKVIVVEGEDRSDVSLGDGLFPTFQVYENRQDEIDLVCVYPDIEPQVVEDFLNTSDYFVIEAENSLVIAPTPDRFGYATQRGNLYGFKANVVPMNRGDSTGAYFIPRDSYVNMTPTDYTNYIIPYGGDGGYDRIYYNVNGNYVPLPTYTDSLLVTDEGFKILDADGNGELFIPPSDGLAKLASGFEELPLNVFNRIGGNASAFIADGVFLSGNLASVTNAQVITGGQEVFAKRSTYAEYSSWCQSVLSFDYSSSDSIWAKRVYKYNIKFSRGNTYDELFFTALHAQSSDSERSFATAGSRTELSFYISSLDNPDGIKVGEIKEFDPVGLNFKDIVRNRLPFKGQTYGSQFSDEYNYRLLGGGTDQKNGLGIRIYDSALLEEWETVAGFTLWVIESAFASYDGVPASTESFTFRTQPFLATSTTIPTNEVYVNGVTGRLDSAGDPITTTDVAYLNTLRLQNYSTYGITAPLKGWGLDYPLADLSGVIQIDETMPQIQLNYTAENTNTKDVKFDMLKYMFGIGCITGGKEAYYDVFNMYNTVSPYTFTKFDIVGTPQVQRLSPTSVFPSVSITYSGGVISVTNVEQEQYLEEYVTGVNNSADARSLWTCGNLLYKRYKAKTTYPKALSDVTGIVTNEDAVQYLKNQYKLAGAVVVNEGNVGLYDRYTVRFEVSREDMYGAGVGIGRNITFTYPNIASGNNGVVTGYDIGELTVTITAECVGSLVDAYNTILITETGTTAYNIIETGTTAGNIVEEV